METSVGYYPPSAAVNHMSLVSGAGYSDGGLPYYPELHSFCLNHIYDPRSEEKQDKNHTVHLGKDHLTLPMTDIQSKENLTTR